MYYESYKACNGSGSIWNSIKIQIVGFWSHTLPCCKPIALLFFFSLLLLKSIARARNSGSFVGVRVHSQTATNDALTDWMGLDKAHHNSLSYNTLIITVHMSVAQGSPKGKGESGNLNSCQP